MLRYCGDEFKGFFLGLAARQQILEHPKFVILRARTEHEPNISVPTPICVDLTNTLLEYHGADIEDPPMNKHTIDDITVHRCPGERVIKNNKCPDRGFFALQALSIHTKARFDNLGLNLRVDSVGHPRAGKEFPLSQASWVSEQYD